MQFVYMGFTQNAGVRRYAFHGVVPKEKNRVFLLSTDLAQLAKHRIGMQEGPTLCLRILGAALEAGELGTQPVLPLHISEADLQRFSAAKDAIAASKLVHRKRRGPIRPAAASAMRAT